MLPQETDGIAPSTTSGSKVLPRIDETNEPEVNEIHSTPCSPEKVDVQEPATSHQDQKRQEKKKRRDTKSKLLQQPLKKSSKKISAFEAHRETARQTKNPKEIETNNNNPIDTVGDGNFVSE